MTIALIPARSGSKRIPNKNIREFNNRPIIGWSIECALNSKLFHHIMVSTDDPDIARISIAEGAEVPFLRPKELADDHSGIMSVMRHSIEQIRKLGIRATEVCLIYATAPFIRIEDLKLGQNVLKNHQCDYAVAVTEFPSPIERALKIMSTGRITMFQPKHYLSRSQDLQTAYHDAGSFCWGKTVAWLEERPPYDNNTFPVYVPRYLVQDFDTIEDWVNAEWMYRSLKSGGVI